MLGASTLPASFAPALTEEEMEYDLPPLSRITLQRVDKAGSWQAYGVTVNQRLLTVSVGAKGRCPHSSPPCPRRV